MATLSAIITPNNITTATNTQTLTNKTLASANLITALTLDSAVGTSGQVLTSAGSGLPTWSTVNVTGSTIFSANNLGGF